KYTFKGRLRLMQCIFDTPAHEWKIGFRAAIVFAALERGRDQVELREDIAESCRQAFAPLQFATEREHRYVREQCECRGEASSRAIVGHKTRVGAGGFGDQRAATQREHEAAHRI